MIGERARRTASPVPLPHAAVGAGDQVSLRSPLLEKERALRDLRVDPHADAHASIVQPPEHLFRSGQTRASRTRSVHWNSRIQYGSKWKTLNGISRSAMPPTNPVTVASS